MSTPISSRRIALVTGARGGIGRELVARLRSAGHRVAAVGRDSKALAEVPADAHIAAAKGGIEALARSAAATYAPLGLRINAVAPGMTETPMTAGMLRVDAMREGAGKQYPLVGVQTAAQVAEVMAWLLSDAAARITGQVLAVDGGFTAVRPLVK